MPEINVASQARAIKYELQKDGDTELNRHDAAGALNKMLDEASTSMKDDKTFLRYKSQLARELSKDFVLTELAVDYALTHMKELDRDGKKGLHKDTDLYGAIESGARERAACSDGGLLHSEAVCGSGGRGDSFNLMMLSELYRSYDLLRMKDGHSHSGAIQKDDLNQYLRERQNRRENIDVAIQLVHPGDRSNVHGTKADHEALFDVLDTAGRGGKGDGRVSKGDLKAFVERSSSYEAHHNDNEVYNSKNRQLAEKILDSWKDGLGKELRDGHEFITVETLKKSFGVNPNVQTRQELATELSADRKVDRAEIDATEKATRAKAAEQHAKELALKADAAEESAEKARQRACQKEAELKNAENHSAKKHSETPSGPSADIVQLLTAQKGQGPWQAAHELLGPQASAKETINLARQIRDAYESCHGGKGSAQKIKPGERWLTDEQWRAIVNGNDKFKGKYAS